MTEPFILHQGDCLEVLRTFSDNSIDSIVTDPPYGLSKEPDMAEVLRHWLAGDDYQHKGGGFMGKSWDSFVPGPAVWRECLRVLKPGGHLLAFFGTRTQDIGTLAIRLAGFEIRDSIAWVYGSGFPKSLDVSKALDKASGAERKVIGPDPQAARQWQGWGTALKPALEPITVARKPLIGTVATNVLTHGTGALNIDGCRVPAEKPTGWGGSAAGGNTWNDDNSGLCKAGEARPVDGRWPANLIHDGSDEVVALFPANAGAAAPVHRRNGDKFRNSYGAFAGNVDEGGSTFHGDSGSAARFFYCAKASRNDRNEGCEHIEAAHTDEQNKLHGAIEYRNICPSCERVLKNSVRECCGVVPERIPSERATRQNNHPTVKPTDLMTYLCRLVTPPGGVVLDPFMGSGSTGKAAMREGFRFIGCERDEDGSGQPLGYMPIAEARINFEWQRAKAQAQAEESAAGPAQLAFFNGSAT